MITQADLDQIALQARAEAYVRMKKFMQYFLGEDQEEDYGSVQEVVRGLEQRGVQRGTEAETPGEEDAEEAQNTEGLY